MQPSGLRWHQCNDRYCYFIGRKSLSRPAHPDHRRIWAYVLTGVAMGQCLCLSLSSFVFRNERKRNKLHSFDHQTRRKNSNRFFFFLEVEVRNPWRLLLPSNWSSVGMQVRRACVSSQNRALVCLTAEDRVE